MIIYLIHRINPPASRGSREILEVPNIFVLGSKKFDQSRAKFYRLTGQSRDLNVLLWHGFV